jgi:hypothetical protein
MGEWHTEDMNLPDFTVHGFHTGRKVRFRLSDGREIEDVYQGWGIFGIGKGFDWMAGEPYVTAWQPLPQGDKP